MNKKGITLVELLAVIIMISIVATIGTISITKAQTKINEEMLLNKLEGIIKIAEVYGEDNKKDLKTKISVSDLVKYGYLEGDANNNITSENDCPTDNDDAVWVDNKCIYVKSPVDGASILKMQLIVYEESNRIYACFTTGSGSVINDYDHNYASDNIYCEESSGLQEEEDKEDIIPKTEESSSGSDTSKQPYIENETDEGLTGSLSQEDDEPKEPESFANDSWATIKKAVKEGNTDAYNVGDTRCITLDGYKSTNSACNNTNQFQLRLVNKTECTEEDMANSNMSQTACGFVIQFVDSVKTSMISASSWPQVTGISPISYSNTDSIYNHLPDDLKNIISDTYVVSSHGYSTTASNLDNNNYGSFSKLYLLSLEEIYKQYDSTYDSAAGTSRQLDYYADPNQDNDNSDAISEYNYKLLAKGSEGAIINNISRGFWTRTYRSITSYTSIYYVSSDGSIGDRLTSSSSTGSGFFPAFRITPSSFSTDDWSTIVKNPDNYSVGETRCITLDGFTTENYNGCSGNFRIRIVNKTSCKENGLASKDKSQTACGFVIAFDDIITTHNIYSKSASSNNDKFTNDWPSSEMRAYLNGVVDSNTKIITYSNTLGTNDEGKIYNALEDDLKKVIKSTYVISGYTMNGKSNYSSYDKLYLLSQMEIFGVSEEDTSADSTRQLDYYEFIKTTDYKTYAHKFLNNTKEAYWTRSVYYSRSYKYIYVATSAGLSSYYSSGYNYNKYGASPAFRIGN